jgi:hypothetical protein
MRSTLRGALTFACLLSVTGLAAQTATTPPLRVLFLGNSLTDGNNVPALVQAMARLQGIELEYTALAPGGYAIEDHWSDGHQALLQSGNFDVLVLQQGPSTLVSSQANLRQWAVTWANEARRFDTQPALYMIWPVRTQNNGFDLVSLSYRNAALAANAAIFPAGEAWEQVINTAPSIALYTDDNLHATPAGSFLAAMVIARGLVSLDPVKVPNIVNGLALPAATVVVFRTVVATLPAATLPAPASAGTPPPAAPPATPVNPPASAPSPGGSSGGGGAPSAWFFLVLLAVNAVRWLKQRAVCWGGVP